MNCGRCGEPGHNARTCERLHLERSRIRCSRCSRPPDGLVADGLCTECRVRAWTDGGLRCPGCGGRDFDAAGEVCTSCGLTREAAVDRGSTRPVPARPFYPRSVGTAMPAPVRWLDPIRAEFMLFEQAQGKRARAEAFIRGEGGGADLTGIIAPEALCFADEAMWPALRAAAEVGLGRHRAFLAGPGIRCPGCGWAAYDERELRCLRCGMRAASLASQVMGPSSPALPSPPALQPEPDATGWAGRNVRG